MDRTTPVHGHRTTQQGPTHPPRRRTRRSEHRTTPGGPGRVTSTRISTVSVFYTTPVDVALRLAGRVGGGSVGRCYRRVATGVSRRGLDGCSGPRRDERHRFDGRRSDRWVAV